MPLTNCSSGLCTLTVVVVLLLVPIQYYLPELNSQIQDAVPIPEEPGQAGTSIAWLEAAIVQCPPFDLAATAALLLLGIFTYLCEWIQRKLMERRIFKLNESLLSSVARLKAWDAEQEALEAKLQLLQHASAEYDLLLYLLLQRHCQPHDKEIDDNNAFLRTPAYDL